MPSASAPAPSSPSLRRLITFPSLVAISINGMVGAGILVLPATIAQMLGAASLFGYIVAAIAVVLVALCFAEAGSHFEDSGGPYLYARSAFGSFIGFEVGWVFVLSRLAGTAAVANAFASYIAYLWPVCAGATGRSIAVSILIWTMAATNCLGVRPGVLVINLLTVAKLVPLLLLLAGLFFIDLSRISFTAVPAALPLRNAGMVLLFAFGGFEFASAPSGEVINPRRTVPLAVITSVAVVVVLYILIQLVCLGTLPGLADDATPLASAASRFLGSSGAFVIAIGAVFSTAGTNSASILVGPRMLYAMSAAHQLPSFLARLHPRYRSPVVSIGLFAAIAWLLALGGTFAGLAAVSALSRLVFYFTTCIAIPVLRRTRPVSEDRFTLRGGLLIPALGAAACVWLFTGAPSSTVLGTVATLVVGAVVYCAYRWFGVPESA